jgi:CheY-like chemotaxis protein
MTTEQGEPLPKTVLVVEDSPVQAFSLVHMLEKEGLNVLCAPNGLAGISMAREYLPSLIVLDIQMPEMDGLEVCKTLKSDPITTKIPIIFLTSLARPELLAEGMQDGAIDFIPKDAFSDFVLLETLRQLSIVSPRHSGGVHGERK